VPNILSGSNLMTTAVKTHKVFDTRIFRYANLIRKFLKPHRFCTHITQFKTYMQIRKSKALPLQKNCTKYRKEKTNVLSHKYETCKCLPSCFRNIFRRESSISFPRNL